MVESGDVEEPSIWRTDYKSYVDFPPLGVWAPLAPELFKGQPHYICVSIYFLYTHLVPSPLLPSSWARVEADEENMKVRNSQGCSGDK